jgi:hypothetical protein
LQSGGAVAAAKARAELCEAHFHSLAVLTLAHSFGFG